MADTDLNQENSTITVGVVWDGQCAGIVKLDSANIEGGEWVSRGTLASRVMENHEGLMPNYLRFLTVEGELAKILNGGADRYRLMTGGVRFLCNVRIGTDEKVIQKLPPDEKSILLQDCTSDGFFANKLCLQEAEIPTNGDQCEIISHEFQSVVRQGYSYALTPKFSGLQLKMPMTLYRNEKSGGIALTPAIETPFTHILKFGSKGRLHETMPVAEWMGLELSEACGLETANHALVTLPKERSHSGADTFGLVVERFDIRGPKDEAHISYFLSDMCNVTDTPPHSGDDRIPDKYNTPIEKPAQAVLEISSDPEADARTFFKRAVFGYCLADMDMHMKNVSVLKTVDKQTGKITTRLSPTYDAVPTRVYPDQRHKRVNVKTGMQEVYYEPDDHLALPVNGKKKDITDEDFFAFAETIGIDQGEAQDIIFEVAVACAERAIEIAKNPPAMLENHQDARFVLWRAASEVADRVKSLTQMEYHNDLEGNYYTYQDYDAFAEKFQAEKSIPEKNIAAALPSIQVL